MFAGFGRLALITMTWGLFSFTAAAQEAPPQQGPDTAQQGSSSQPPPAGQPTTPPPTGTSETQPVGPAPQAVPQVPAGAPGHVEEMIVTGSRIRTNPLDQPAPVTTLTASELAKTGLTSIGDVLQRLPASGAAINSKFNQSGNAGFSPDGGGTGAGSAEIDLRYLNSKRTLVLVDGLRWVPGSAASGVPAASDLNTIPVAIIDRIEVLQDGASSIYGSDAIGGVVNIITKKRVDGVQANAYVGSYQQGDGVSQQYDLLWGNSTDRASIVVGATYVKSGVVWSKDRAISKYDVPGLNHCIPGYCSTISPYGRYIFDDNDLTYDPTTGGYRDWSNQTDRFNFQPFNMVNTPSQRMGAFTQVDYSLTNNVHFNAKLLFNNRSSENQAAPEPLQLGPDAGTLTAADRIVISDTNPYNPFGQTLDSSTNWVIYRRAIEAGPRIFNQSVNTWYGSGGFSGSIPVGDHALTWDATILYSQNNAQQVKNNGINVSKLAKGLGPLADCQADPSCVPIDIFHGPGSLTPEMVRYIKYQQHDLSDQTMWDAVANVSGDLFTLPGGNFGIAAGVEHRDLSGSFKPDAIVAGGDTGDVPAQPTSGSYYANEAYLEALLPILSNVPAFELLDVSGAVRISDYSSFGTTSTFKAGLRWRPFADLLLRGTLAQGFRAPSIGELYGSPGRYDANITDPCNTPETGTLPPDVVANCTANGVPPGTGYFQNNSQISVTTGGNKDLKPEKSLGWNASFVYSPSFVADTGILDKLSLEAGWYRIRLTDAITTDPNVYLSECIATLDPLFCNGIQRAPDGQIIGFSNLLRNIGGITTSGIDWALGVSLPRFALGQLRLDWLGTYLIEFTEDYPSTGGTTAIKRVGTELGDPERGYPRVKSNAILTWLGSDFSASWGVRYLSGIRESCDGLQNYPGFCSVPNPEQPSSAHNDLRPAWYHDVQVTYAPESLDRRVSITAGVNNLFDFQPPVCQSCALNNFDASLYDVPGRFGYLRAGVKL